MQSFIIHMPGDAKRAPNAEALLNTLSNAQIVDAVIGKKVLEHGALTPLPGNLHAPRYPFTLSAGEVGCFLSHRACWQKIVDEDLDYALIAEDDLSITPDLWAEAMDLVETHATADTFIRLPAKHRETPAQMVADRTRAKLFLPKVIGLQTVCQVVGKNAAKRLLKVTEELDRPVDTFLQMHWITQQPIHTILPNGVSEITEALGGSTIQKKATSNKILREINRAVYRARVSLRPQRP
ncbi:glycosyltransferase family 25 protein [Tropicibacter sp. R16_0]|uniref:glycosyltransferase family 25 protein n=1 Tax=Tropicibacter sp. R16_0 TaxID=2821102 RepID=UPI001ADA43B6|nr:glycosyltransferase family 25 protein [Tropicibacter sp. R16_0]MBO9450648.1 glycosyltransferase family 25 protein [Tropicibacter sp. R16_0]